MADRHANKGLRKVCDCPRRTWAKCSHSWYLNFKPRGGRAYRLSLDKQAGKHLDSKTDAEKFAEQIRAAIRAGTFEPGAPVVQVLTLTAGLKAYEERHGQANPRRFAEQRRVIEGTVVTPAAGEGQRFGDWPLASIAADSLERFRAARRSAGSGEPAINRNLSFLRAFCNWAVGVAGYLERTPFKRGSVTVVKLTKEAPRTRRLQEGEEDGLRKAGTPHLRDVVTAALETGMRRGELLTLQWRDVHGQVPTAIEVRASKSKTGEGRLIPVSSRLRAVLEMRRCDPAGQELPPDAFVFGTEIGTPLTEIGRAWDTAVLKAHGHRPQYTATKNLTADSRAALNAIGLHFHDLRREAGSRWLEAGVPLHVIRDWLGHANISQTSTYLSGTVKGRTDAMRMYDEHRERLQRIATGGQTGGRKRKRTAGPREENTSKTATHHNPTVM